MALLANVHANMIGDYNTCSVFTQTQTKKERLYFNVQTTHSEIEKDIEEIADNTGVLAVDYQGDTGLLPLDMDFKGLYVYCVRELQDNFTEQEIENILGITPSNMTVVLTLPEGYCDMERLAVLCRKFPTVRFQGGYLFRMDNVRIGAIGYDILDKLGIRYKKGTYIIEGKHKALKEVELEGLELILEENKVKGVAKAVAVKGKSTAKKSKGTDRPVQTAPKKRAYQNMITRRVEL